LKLSVFAFGKLKTPGLKDAAVYYRKMSLVFGGVDEIELTPLAAPDKSSATRKLIQDKEELLLSSKLEALGKRASIYLLDEGGKKLSTLGWAKLIQNEMERGQTNLVFCVGSSLGFSEGTRERAHGSISLGAQTLPHELARVVLYEQIFRALSHLKGHPYHNEGT